MKAQEIKKAGIFSKDDIHCFTDCGYNCKAKVRADLEAHYSAIAAALGKGWRVNIWHNGGWHANLAHDESQFYLSDRAVRGGISAMKVDADRFEGNINRFEVFNYEYPEGTSQVWVYGDDPKDAIRNAFNAVSERVVAYMVQQQKILDAFPE